MVSGTVGFNRQFRKQTPLNYASQWTRMKPRAAQRGVLLRPIRHKNKRRHCVDKRHTPPYIPTMKTIRWDEQKNEWLKQNRGLGFEQVAVLIEQGQVLEVVDHPDQRKYPKQKMAIVEIDGYACLVPYVDAENDVFLKTIIPSRKATKKYLRGQK